MRFITLLFLALTACAVSVNAQMNDANEAIERGNGFFHRGQYELAIFEYRGALNWPGGHQARAHFNIGVCKYRLGRPREAVTEYGAAIKFSKGQYPSAFYGLGIALQDLRRYQEAREVFAQAVKVRAGNTPKPCSNWRWNRSARVTTARRSSITGRPSRGRKTAFPHATTTWE
jgi:tetratricopeptide (TPR) repeat protein